MKHVSVFDAEIGFRTCAELMWEDGGKMREAKGEIKDKECLRVREIEKVRRTGKKEMCECVCVCMCLSCVS